MKDNDPDLLEGGSLIRLLSRYPFNLVFFLLIGVKNVDSQTGLTLLKTIQSEFNVFSVVIKKMCLRGGSGT